MIKKTSLLILILLAMLVRKGFGQQLQFEQFTTASGLPADRVYNVYMDSRGYIWVCTNYGIARYNGSAFIPVCMNIPFRERFIYAMYEDRQGRLWISNSRCHIYTVRNDSAMKVNGFEPFSDELQKKGVDLSDLYVDDAGNIFVTTRSLSYELEKKKGYAVKNLSEAYTNDSTDFVVLTHKERDVLVCRYEQWQQDSAFYHYKVIAENGSAEKKRIRINSHAVIRNALHNRGNLYLSAGSELMKISPHDSTLQLSFSHMILCVTVDPDNNTWLGLDEEGIYKLSPQGKILAHYFNGTTVNCILFDDQSGMWVSTSGQGMYHCRNIHDHIFPENPALQQPLGLITQLDHTLFIGTNDGGLYRLQKDGAPEKLDLKGLSQDMIGDMIKSRDNGSYYIACKDNLLKADTAFRQVTPCLYKGKPVAGLAMAYNNGGRLLVLSRKALGAIENDHYVPICAVPTKAYCMLNDGDNGMLIGTAAGVYLYAHDSIFMPPYLQPLKDYFTLSMRRDANGNAWICTVGHGLVQMRKDHGLVYYPQLPADVLHDIFFVNDTTIGLCLNNGIFVTSLSKIGDLKKWYQLNKAESASPQQYGDKLYATTNTGLVSFSLDDIRNRNNSKLYFIKAVTGDSAYYQQPLVFRHDQNKIDLYFDLLDFTTLRQQLLYRLEGGGTVETGTVEGTQLRLRKLTPGTYTLTVSSATALFYTNEKALTLTFTITPAFWQTRWFSVFIALLALSLIGIVIYMTNRRVINRERQKARIERMLAEHKLTALKAQINPHFISNALSAIQQLIMDDEADKAGLYLSKFSLLIRYVLKYSDKAVVQLRDELEVIDLNIQLEALRFKDDFGMETEIADDIDTDNVEVPPLITQPFIENAIWHGLLPLKGKRKPRLIVRVSKLSKGVLISIEDNGVGRNTKRNTLHESRGTAIIVNRLENINLVQGEKIAALTIDDLQDAEGNACGTRVNITLPDKLNHTDYDEN